jgi:glutathione synthase/RimK-type ligase-like ATP-grasp enzyme
MIACLYGRSAALFVEPVVVDLLRAAARRRVEIVAVTLETALATRQRWRDTEALYVLPFEIPLGLPTELPLTPAALVRELFPRATVANSLAAHERCWDKLATAQRLLERGVPIPTTLSTSDPEEARAFITEHGHALLKEPRSCAGHGHLVVFPDAEGSVVGEARGRRYVVELQETGTGRTISHGIFHYPPPFLLQRLVATPGRGGVLRPAQILRAYIVDRQVVFWTERYRNRIRRPSDFIISVALGAKYRFLPAVSEEVRKVAMRAAEALDVSVGVVDLIRSSDEGPAVLEVDTDGPNMMIDRSFKSVPDYRPAFDFDDFIAEALIGVGGLGLRG